MNPEVAIIIPVYNEEKVIRETLDSILKKYSTVICIDDGSSDRSAAEVSTTTATLLRHSINLGQGAALQTGLDFALEYTKSKYFVTFDADGQHDLGDVEKMVIAAKKCDVEVVLGSRFLGNTAGLSNFKKNILKLAVMFSNITTGVKLTDTHNGIRLFTRKAAECMNLNMPDYSHASEIIERIAQKKLLYMEVPVTIHYTEYSLSKGQSLLNAINIAFDILLKKVSKK